MTFFYDQYSPTPCATKTRIFTFLPHSLVPATHLCPSAPCRHVCARGSYALELPITDIRLLPPVVTSNTLSQTIKQQTFSCIRDSYRCVTTLPDTRSETLRATRLLTILTLLLPRRHSLSSLKLFSGRHPSISLRFPATKRHSLPSVYRRSDYERLLTLLDLLAVG